MDGSEHLPYHSQNSSTEVWIDPRRDMVSHLPRNLADMHRNKPDDAVYFVPNLLCVLCKPSLRGGCLVDLNAVERFSMFEMKEHRLSK
jgi:hypothetical protein